MSASETAESNTIVSSIRHQRAREYVLELALARSFLEHDGHEAIGQAREDAIADRNGRSQLYGDALDENRLGEDDRPPAGGQEAVKEPRRGRVAVKRGEGIAVGIVAGRIGHVALQR